MRSAIFSSALLLLTKDAAHLVDGYFDCERMLRMLNEGVEAALNAGAAGLRTCGDISWLLAAPDSHQVVEYESLLNRFVSNVRGLGMCQYDRARLPAALLHQHSRRIHRPSSPSDTRQIRSILRRRSNSTQRDRPMISRESSSNYDISRSLVSQAFLPWRRAAGSRVGT